jgi:carbon storage regulator
MLVLSRKEGQRIRIGDSVVVTVVGLSGGRVRLGIEGPVSVPIHREEVYRRIQAEQAGRRRYQQPLSDFTRASA